MSYWFRFTAPEAEEPSRLWIRGVQANVFPSPHDIPEAFRTYADAESRQLVVEFKYIDQEPQVELRAGGGLWFSIGRNSHRLYQIHTSADFVKLEDPVSKTQFLGELDCALEKLEKRPGTASATLNYEVLRRGIAEQDIFGHLTRGTSG